MYYNVDNLFKSLYLPYVIPYTNGTNDIISNNEGLYFLLRMTSFFMLSLYSYTISYNLFITKTKDNNCIGLSFIYIKHILDILTMKNMSIVEYEISRSVMWAFTTPLMLKMYCDSNDISLWDINAHYNQLFILPYVFIVPFKYTFIYYGSVFILSIPAALFMRTLYKYKTLKFTYLYIIMWSIFSVINLLDCTRLFNSVVIHALYNLSDTLCKFICSIVIHNYNENESIVRDNMDLQSVQFVSHMIKSINQFESDNNKLTPVCNNLTRYCKKKFLDKLPKQDDKLKLELLAKILPFNMDQQFIGGRYRGRGNRNLKVRNDSDNKEFSFICVMFVDIVNYTELATRYKSGDIIFNLLDDIYYLFDTIIKKYYHLQKIETIGDAYMVVGDIYRQNINHKLVIKEIIKLGLEYIKEIKTIKTPDDIPLCIRIGINIGNVNIGILGQEIPRLCVVGNTVNMASRLQSTADPDTIQMSRHIYEQTQESNFGFDINVQTKEGVFLKNIGTTTTYVISPPR